MGSVVCVLVLCVAGVSCVMKEIAGNAGHLGSVLQGYLNPTFGGFALPLLPLLLSSIPVRVSAHGTISMPQHLCLVPFV